MNYKVLIDYIKLMSNSEEKEPLLDTKTIMSDNNHSIDITPVRIPKRKSIEESYGLTSILSIDSNLFNCSYFTVSAPMKEKRHPFSIHHPEGSYTTTGSSEERKVPYYRGKPLSYVRRSSNKSFNIIQYEFQDNSDIKYDIIVLNKYDPFEGWITESSKPVISDNTDFNLCQFNIVNMTLHTSSIILRENFSTNYQDLHIKGDSIDIYLNPINPQYIQGYHAV